MPGDFYDIDTDQIIRESISQVITVAKITLRLSIMSIRAARVIVSAMVANHEHREKLQEFSKRYGKSLGFLEINTENHEKLADFEALLRKGKVEYSRLPDLQVGDGQTQYLYDLDALDKLSALIHQNEENRLHKLADLKTKYAHDPASFLSEKEKIDVETPSITLITAEDYARTSIKEGRDTAEFLELESSAEKELSKAAVAGISADDDVKRFFGQLSTGKSVQSPQFAAPKIPAFDRKALMPEISKRRSR